ncbi:MAG: TIGR00730 family Rossman fold protein [Cohaesibacteraceae bacterium]|nr:TIGR00730 family Rossman fold protein [Cohaesibacteraceae bacterium]
MVKRICVYCGSNPGNRPAYKLAAVRLAETIVERGYELVYGGANVGIMGVIADAALAKGGKVHGVIPGALIEKEIAHQGLTRLYSVGSMAERKQKMADLSDGFVSLPGGAGTMDEMFEMWVWAQLGWNDKPSALMNVEGYYDHLLRFLDHQAKEGYVKQAHRDMLVVSDNASDILDQFENYVAPNIGKWVEKSD